MEQFLSDPDVAHGVMQLCKRYQMYQSKLVGIRSPQESLSVTYDQLIAQYQKCRGGQLFYPYLGTGMGSGALVELADGSIKYDMISGIGAHFSHGHPDIVKSSVYSAFSNMIMQGNLQQNCESQQLLVRLCEISEMDSGVLTTSGVMAVENALKLIFQYQFPKSRLLAFEQCFAGRTLAVSQITDKAQYRDGLPDTLSVDYLPFYDETDPQGSIHRTVRYLNQYLDRYPGQYAAMVLELIQGEGGYYPGSGDFFEAIITVLKEHDILVLVDEIQSFGRTSSFFAYQMMGLSSLVDVVTVGKLTQVCATLFREKLTPRPGLISQTFTASTSSIYAAMIILDQLEKKCLGSNGYTLKLRAQFMTHFKKMEAEFGDHFSGPYGCGGMLAFTPFQGDRERVMALLRRLFDQGVIGFLCGSSPVRVRFLPPLGGLTVSDVDQVMEVVKTVMRDLIKESQ